MKDKMNIPPFYIGEKVECIVGFRDILIKGNQYKITHIQKCGCDIWYVGFGIPHFSSPSKLKCPECSHEQSTETKHWVAAHYFFRSLERNTFKPITFNKIVDIEETQILFPN